MREGSLHRVHGLMSGSPGTRPSSPLTGCVAWASHLTSLNVLSSFVKRELFIGIKCDSGPAPGWGLINSGNDDHPAHTDFLGE